MNKRLLIALLTLQATPCLTRGNDGITIALNKARNIALPELPEHSRFSFLTSVTNPPVAALSPEGDWYCILCKEVPTLNNLPADDDKASTGADRRILISFDLRDDAFWDDGQPVEAEDIKHSMTVFKRMGYLPKTITVESGKNPKRFSLSLQKPRADYMQALFFPILRRDLDGPAWDRFGADIPTYINNSPYRKPIGVPGLSYGPYVIKHQGPGSLYLAPNPYSYQRGRKSLESIDILLTDKINRVLGEWEPQERLLIPEGQLDFSDLPKTVSQIRSPVFNGGWIGILFNHRNPTFQDVRLRQAFSQILDRELLFKDLFGIHQSQPNLLPLLKDQRYHGHKEQGINLLKNAGWYPGSKGLLTRGNQVLNISIAAPDDPVSRNIVALIAKQLFDYGIGVNVNLHEASSYHERTLQRSDFHDLALIRYKFPDIFSVWSLFHSKAVPTKSNYYIGANFGGWFDPSTDQLLDQLMGSSDRSQVTDAALTLCSYLAGQMPWIPLGEVPEPILIPRGLNHFKTAGLLSPSGLSIASWTYDSGAAKSPIKDSFSTPSIRYDYIKNRLFF